MPTLYRFKCVACGAEDEFFRPADDPNKCAECWNCGGHMGRVYTSPVLGLRAVGRDQSTLLTPVHRWKPTDDLSERRIRDAAARDVGRVHFGYGTGLPETGGGPKRSAEPREGE